MRFHGEPAEGQLSAVSLFLKFFEYLIGHRVVPRAAGNQVDLSAACVR